MSEEITSIARSIGVTAEEVEVRHPSVRQVLRFFTFEHLPHGVPRRVSAMCASIAGDMISTIPADDPELTTGLRKLLEAKDCFVRAAIVAAREADK